MPGVDVNAEIGRSPWTQSDRDGVVRAMQRARLDRAIVASRRALLGDVPGGNAELKAALDGQETLLGWVTVDPVNPELSTQELRKYAASAQMAGLRLDTGILGLSLFTDATSEIVNNYRRFTKPALVSVRNERDVTGLEQLAKAVPTVKFIAAGAGGDAWQECGALAKRVVNVMLEPFSGGPHRGKIEWLVTLLGTHRILFSTGFPNQNPGASLGLLADAQIADNEKQAILTGSAKRIFGWE